ncbi:hypothetical protein BDY24DRAFT_380828 [Mrakia frigida]|uniref:Vps54p n=1 Tax=Mrakia frigida TaxID=29902 RepID=UPI003FCC10B3
MDISRSASPAVSESVFSDSALTQLEGDASKPFDLTRLRLERAGSTTSSSGGHDLSNLNLVSLSRPWNDDSHPDQNRRGFHAISTVLNHPFKRSAPLRASRIPLPPGPQAEVFPKVNRKDIDAYVKSISPEWDRFEQARSARAGVPSSFDGVGEQGERQFQPVKDEKDLPKLSLVPEVFFEPEFNIGNPHIFDVVTEQFPPPSFTSSSSNNVATPRKPSFASPSPTPSSPSFLPTLNPLPSSSSLPSSPLPSATPRASTFSPRQPPHSALSTPGGGPIEDVTTNQVLQDKLNSYLDVVEQHLVLEISRRSSSFFAALTNLQDLQSESSSCLSRIDSLRTELVALDEGQAQRGLEVVRLHRTLGGLKRVEGAVREVRGVEEAVGMIKSLVAAGDGYGAVEIWEEVDGWVKRKGKGKEREQLSINVSEDGVAGGSGAAGKRSASPSSRPSPRSSPRFKPAGLHDLAELPEGDSEELSLLPSSSSTSHHLVPPPRDSSLSSQTTTSPHPPPTKHRSSSSASKPSSSSSSRYPPTDLTTLSSLSHLPQTLAALALAIATQLESELHAVLVGEMSKPRSPEALEDGLKGRIGPLVEGLIRVREGGRLVGVYREVAIGEIKEAVKRHMPGGGEGGTEEEMGGVNGGAVATKAPLVKALKDLDHAEFLAIEKAMFSGLIACVRTIEVFSKAIESILEDASTLNSSLSSTLPSIKGDLSDVLSTASELANSRASKIIGVRNEQHAALQLGQFLEMFSEAWSFVVACEVICRKMIVGLRGTMVVQAKTFLQTYHSQRVSTSARLVENELWAPEETTPAQQHVVDLLLESAVADPFELVIVSSTSSSSPSNGTPTNPQPSATNGTSNGTTPATNKKHLQIEDRSYFVVGATLGTLELLLDYIKIVINIDLLTTDAMSKIIEFLKSFNSRTCQVVLGAGAMRSAGLKNITAKHLALASQSLSIMIALIPYIRETLRRHLNPKQAVMLVEFDKLKRDYQEHQNEIHSKLVAIMGDRLSLHLKALREIEWEAPSRRPGKPNEYIELLVKETTQLHKILSRYLPDQTVDSVSSQVFASINHGLSEAYQTIELRSEDAKARLLLDATHLHSKLSLLPNTTPISSLLVTLVKDKSTPRLPVGASMKMLMRRVSQRSDGPSSPSGGVEKELVGESLGNTLGSSGMGTPVSELEEEAKEKETGTESVQVVVSKPEEEEEEVKLDQASPSPTSIHLPPSPLPPLPSLPSPTSPISSQEPTINSSSSPPPPPPTPSRESELPPIPPKSPTPPSVSSDLPPLPSQDPPSSSPPPSIPPKEKEKAVEGESPSLPIEVEEEEGVSGDGPGLTQEETKEQEGAVDAIEEEDGAKDLGEDQVGTGDP